METWFEQKVISTELGHRISLVGEDPRQDGAILLNLVEHRRCAEREVTRVRVEEHTKRRITNWTSPIAFGLLGGVATWCSVTAAITGECIPEVEEAEESRPAGGLPGVEPPERSSEGGKYSEATIWGAIALLSFGIVAIDLVEARDSVEQLEETEKYGDYREYACESRPASYQTFVYRFHSNGPVVWQGQTDRHGEARIPMSQVDWVHQGNASLGVIEISTLGTKRLPTPPRQWREARAAVQFEEEFERVRQINTPERWWRFYRDYKDSTFGEEALPGYFSSIEQMLAEGKWVGVSAILNQASREMPAIWQERIQTLLASAAVLEIQAARAGEVERSFTQILKLYRLATSSLPDSERIEALHRDAWDYISGQMRAFIRQARFDELEKEGADALIDYFARTDEQKAELQELEKAIGSLLVMEAVKAAIRLESSREATPAEVQDAYLKAYNLAVQYEDPIQEELGYRYATSFLQILEAPIETKHFGLVEDSYGHIREGFPVDKEILDRAYIEYLLQYFLKSLANYQSDQAEFIAQLIFDRVQNDEQGVAVTREWLEELSTRLLELVETERVQAISLGRRLINDPNLETIFSSPDAQAFLGQQRQGLRRQFARQIRLSEVRDLEDALWLATPHIQTKRQIQALLNDPSGALNRRALLSFTLGDSLGDGGYLANLHNQAGQIVVYGMRHRRRQVQAIVEIVDTLADGRGQGGSIPVVRVLWVQ